MGLKAFLHIIPFGIILWSYSRFAPVGKNAGFFCNDTSIGEPYLGDSIGLTMLLSSLMVSPSLIIYISELVFKEHTCEDASHVKNSSKWYIKRYHSGLLFVLAVTEVLKLWCGELRPHFLASCQPDMEHIKCSDGYITNFRCTRDIPVWMKKDMYKSFPSGHAAISFYAFIFLSIYLNSFSKNATKMSLRCWKALIVTISLSWSVVCCVSRLMDRRHFWWDVLFGIFIGLIGGLLMGQWCVYQSSQQKVKK